MNAVIDTQPRRRGRGMARASLAIIAATQDILAEIQPASVRAVCYRLFTQGLIPNMSKGSTDKVSRLLVGARESGAIPWEWIVDETREAESVPTWDNPDAIMSAAASQYRKDYWSQQPERVEVWTEKGTVRGTLAPVLRQYGITLRVMHGYGSATAIYGAAQDTATSDKPLTVFYAGDWDPSGLHMSEIDLPDRLARYGGHLEIVRIALTADDVAAGTDLPHFDAETKTGDPRYRWFRDRFGARCWELDALNPNTLRQRVADAVESRLDLAQWKQSAKIESAEKNSIADFMDRWQSIFRQAPNCPDQEVTP